MGHVYLAEDPALERQVAIKLLHQDTGGLRHEAKALAALRHPGIVTVFEVGEHEGRDFIAMEYLPGRTLRELIPEFATRRAELVAICAKVALAVDAAHRAGILHRDIKPENIIVTDEGEVKVVDFGIARRELPDRPSSATMTDLAETYARTLPPGYGDTIRTENGATITGTPTYMAPELLYGESASVASDTYSLGVVLYECVTGRRPHSGRNLVELITNIVETPIPRLDDELGDLVARMLDPEPPQRIILEDVARQLVPRVALPRSVIAAIAIGTLMSIAAVVVVGYFILAKPAQNTATVAVAIELELSNAFGISYGNRNPDARLTAETLVRYFNNVEGTRIVGIALTGPGAIQNPSEHATHFLHGSIRYTNDGKRFHARFQLDDLSGTLPSQTIDETDPVFGALIQNVAAKTATAIDPLAVFNREREHDYARKVLDQAKTLVAEARYHEAIPLLDAAVEAHPKLADAWYYLALTRNWLVQPEARIQEAIDSAVERGADSADRRGFSPECISPRYARPHHGRADGAERRVRLAIFTTTSVKRTGTTGVTARAGGSCDRGRSEVRAGHDSRHGTAFSPRSVCHAGLSHEPLDAHMYALGKYEELATARPVRDGGLGARITLGHDLTEAEIERRSDLVGAYRIARAVARGEDAEMRRIFERVWHDVIDKNPTELAFHAIDHLGEVVLTAGLADQSRRLVAFLAKGRRRSYERFAILAAAVTRDRSLIPDTFTERDAALAIAVHALLDGDAAKGIAGVATLVADPTAYWDYPERALLVRELRAAGRIAEADAVCADSLRPAVFRIAIVSLRQLCETR
jgi:predicted Ser/Thr protein kinase